MWFFRHWIGRCTATISWAVLCLILLTSLQAQEPVRSGNVLLPIQSFRRSPDAFFYLGPFQEVVTTSVGFQYTDNVNLTQTDRISDLSFSAGLGLDTTWVISHLNQLQFTFGGTATEHFYGNGRDKLTLAVDPTSQIEFKFAVSDLQVRLYDQFSYTQDPTTDPTATNTSNLNSLTNTIGATVNADLNIAEISMSAGYSYNTQSGQNAQGQDNESTTGTRNTFRAGPTVTFRLSPTIVYGINSDVTRSTSSDAANVSSVNFGPFINGKLSKEFEFDVSGGINLIDTKPHIPAAYYYAFAIRYQINRHWQLLLSGAHDLIFTTGTNLTEENLFKLGTQMQVTRAITLSVAPFINFGEVKTTTLGTVNGISAPSVGDYTLYGLGATLGWKLRNRWTTAVSYNYVRRTSGATFGTGNSGSNNYIQNSFAFSINYLF